MYEMSTTISPDSPLFARDLLWIKAHMNPNVLCSQAPGDSAHLTRTPVCCTRDSPAVLYSQPSSESQVHVPAGGGHGEGGNVAAEPLLHTHRAHHGMSMGEGLLDFGVFWSDVLTTENCSGTYQNTKIRLSTMI